jgi:hypothetical protein
MNTNWHLVLNRQHSCKGKNGVLLKEWQVIETKVIISGALDTFPGDYYYAKVTQLDGNEAISSPVFIKAPDRTKK